MTTKHIFITTTGYSTFVVPADFEKLISIEAIGSGGKVFGGGGKGSSGGGAYATSTNILNITANSILYCYVGSGGDTVGTWLSTSNTAPTSSTLGVLADYGKANAGAVPGSGGLATNCIGSLAYSGGSGATSGFNADSGGGGGAAGPLGPGGNVGLSAGSGIPGGGGGGANGGTDGIANNASSNASNGGNGPFGIGGGIYNGASAISGTGGGGASAIYGSSGAMYNQWFGSIYPDISGTGTWAGPAGGNGGGWNSQQNATLYGAGIPEGVGSQGIIVFTYATPNPIISVGPGISISGGITFS